MKRMRKYFAAFPAHAGMFLPKCRARSAGPCLPRARGDVSIGESRPRLESAPSPRTRGCFRTRWKACGRISAFPAHAGMFRLRTSLTTRDSGLPRARGDVSFCQLSQTKRLGPSPRTRGCFHPRAAADWPGRAFPAHAGMFPRGLRVSYQPFSLPRARGDVSIWHLSTNDPE